MDSLELVQMASLKPHSLSTQARKSPLRLVFFSTRNGLLHTGQDFGTGLSHVAKVQSGYRLHPKKTLPRFERFSTISPSQPGFGHFIPMALPLPPPLMDSVCLQSGYPLQAKNSPYLPRLMTIGLLHLGQNLSVAAS